MSSGLRKLGTITTRFRRARQKANARITEATNPTPAKRHQADSFLQEKRGNLTDCPQGD